MRQPCVHQAYTARLPVTGHALRQQIFLQIRRHCTGEPVAVKQRMDRPTMRSRYDRQRAIGLVNVVEEQERGDDIIVGMRV